MKKDYTKYIIGGVIGAIVLFLVIASWPEVKMGGNNTTACATAVATATVSYVNTTIGTSTLTCSSGGMTAFDMLLVAKASSSAVNFFFNVEVSENNSDWYPYATTTDNNNLSSTQVRITDYPILFTVNLATSTNRVASVYKYQSIPLMFTVPHKYFRINYQGSGGAAVHLNVIRLQ